MNTITKAVTASIRAGWNIGLDLLFPTECVQCRAPGQYICAKCMDQCATAGPGDPKHNRQAFDSLTAAFEMDGPARRAVHSLKYRDLRAIATLMGSIMAERIADTHHEYDLIIPMPLHPSRQKRRGYNQAELLASVIAKRTNKPMDTTILKRALKTPSLASLQSLEERRDAIEGAFHCTADDLQQASILLVDDVITSGSTCGAAADELKNANAQFVHALSFALET